MPIVHGGAASPFVRKVRVIYTEKGVDHEHRNLIPIPKTPELLAKHPMGLVPILEDGDLMLPDSSAIFAYVERKHPSPPLLPSDARDAAWALWLEEYADTAMVRSLTQVFFQRFVAPNILGQPTDEEEVNRLLNEEAPPVFDYLESQVSGDFLVGSSVSIADIAVATQIANLQYAGEKVDSARWPKFAAYVSAILERPSFAKVMADEAASMAGGN